MRLFAVDALHHLVHRAIALPGQGAAARPGSAVLYARARAVVHGLLTLIGLVPGFNTTFGYIPLFGHDVWLHALSAATATFCGFAGPWLGSGGRRHTGTTNASPT